VRKSLGLTLKGDSANQAWGVMDILGNTDFPDIRLKAVIQSRHGSVVLIPREGGYMFRIYVELDRLSQSERVADKQLTIENLVAAANRIFAPYKIEPKEVPWWSVYEIGQRLSDRFDDDAEDPRIFIAGDACHTHSPKAGQGMNVSMQDAYNLGWKLAAVLRGRSAPALLKTYSAERQAIAAELIGFDKDWAGMLHRASKGQATAAEVQEFFVRQGRYTAGTATRYRSSILTGSGARQNLAQGFVTGMRFHSAPVIRLADAKSMQLAHCMKADGKWRLFAFADKARTKLAALCGWLENDVASPFKTLRATGEDVDATIDFRAVLQQTHASLTITDMPAILFPHKGKLGLRDYEKVFCADPRQGVDIFDTRGVNRAEGCMVIVRPDQYVADILALDDEAGLARFFNAVFLPRG
jgi:hypothetical protein